MAGVAGIRQFTTDGATQPLLPSLLPLLRHRFRAGAEAWSSGPIELSIARDPFARKQPRFIAPPTSRCGRYVCAFDGVLTNRAFLRERVASSWCRVRGPQDVELLLEHIAAFGIEDTLSRLDGAFAVAIWDHQRGELTLARDRFGLRSLALRVVREMDGRPRHVIFASERKALHVQDTADPQHAAPAPFVTSAHRRLLARLADLPLPAPTLRDEDAMDVEPGHAVTFRADGVRIEKTFAGLAGLINDPAHGRELRALPAVDRVERLLDAASRSIRAQTQGAENVICLVGGDLASCVVAALTARLGITMRLLHVDTGCPKRRAACEALAERLAAPLITMRATDAAVRANIVDATWHLESPMPARSFAVPLYQACHRASGLRADVVLHGGGGRILLGTPLAAVRRGIARMQRWLTAAEGRIRAQSGERFAGFARRRSTLSHVAAILRTASLRAAAESGDDRDAHRLRSTMEGPLHRAERMSAAWGIELRMPFVTEELVALAHTLPASVPAHLPSLLRRPTTIAAMLTPLGQMAGRLLSPELIGQCRLGTRDLPTLDLPVDPDFLASGALMPWLGAAQAGGIGELLDQLPSDARQELLLCDIWARLFVTGTPCDDITRSLLGHPPAAEAPAETDVCVIDDVPARAAA